MAKKMKIRKARCVVCGKLWPTGILRLRKRADGGGMICRWCFHGIAPRPRHIVRGRELAVMMGRYNPDPALEYALSKD